ncbi:Rv0361 family membrane protein [Blastococcus sp. SYSU DS0973]
MTQGPFLYDDGPAPLHTGMPRRRQGWLIAGILGVVLMAGGMVAGLYVVRGSPADQATEVTQVFLAALDAGDTETSYQLLCGDERSRLDVTGMEAEYLRPGSAEVADVRDDPVEGARIQRVTVRWEDGASAELAVVNEDGPRICGID